MPMTRGPVIGRQEGTSAAETFHPNSTAAARVRAPSALVVLDVCRPIVAAIVAAAATATGRRVTRHVPSVIQRCWRWGAVSRARAGIAPRALQSNGTRRLTRKRAPVRPVVVVVVIRTTAAYGVRRTRPIQFIFFHSFAPHHPPLAARVFCFFFNNIVTMSFPPFPIYVCRRPKCFSFTFCHAIVVGQFMPYLFLFDNLYTHLIYFVIFYLYFVFVLFFVHVLSFRCA